MVLSDDSFWFYLDKPNLLTYVKTYTKMYAHLGFFAEILAVLSSQDFYLLLLYHNMLLFVNK